VLGRSKTRLRRFVEGRRRFIDWKKKKRKKTKSE
jgi:hypothetical protein